MKKGSKISILMSVIALFALVSTIAVSAVAEDIAASQAEKLENKVLPAEESPVEYVGGIQEDDDIGVSVTDHAYGSGKLLCVTVNNLNQDVNYSINVKVTYFDGDGNALGTQTQFYDQLTAGSPQNFVFKTDYDFADYYLETEKTVYDGDCWKADITVDYGGMNYGFGDHYVNGEKNRANSAYPAYVAHNNGENVIVATSVTMVIFDDNGEVFDVLERGGGVWFRPDFGANYKHFQGWRFPVDDPAAQAEFDSISETTGFVAWTIVLEKDFVY